MINDLTDTEYRDKCKERWKYLIMLLQFWMDNNAMVCIRGGPIRPMSALAKFIKDTANCVLPSGFQISWKHIIQQTPWYQYWDYHQLLAITPRHSRHHLEDAMLQHHNKTVKLLKEQTRRDPCPVHPKKDHQWEPIDTPASGQFNLDDDLEVEFYNPLETPTDMPIQDESAMPILEDVLAESAQSNVVTPA